MQALKGLTVDTREHTIAAHCATRQLADLGVGGAKIAELRAAQET